MNDAELMQLDREIARANGLKLSDYYEWAYIVDDNYRQLPKYSTDIAEAIKLWGNVSDDYTPRLVRILSPHGDSMGYLYKAVIMPNVGSGVEFEAIADAAPLAICLAFVSYKNHTIPHD